MTKAERIARRAAKMPTVAGQFVFAASYALAQPKLLPEGQPAGMLDEKWAVWHKEVLSRPASKREVNA